MSKGRSYKRGGSFRDSRRFLIFTEGAKREVRYFEAVGVDERRVSVLVFGANPLTNDSSPEQTLARAIAQIKKSPLMEDDRVWLVIDKDRWSEKQLMLVQRACKDRAGTSPSLIHVLNSGSICIMRNCRKSILLTANN